MKTIQIPHVAQPLSKICLGTSFFGTRTPEETARDVMKCYFAHGGRFFNTAHEYGLGAAETVLGKWIREQGVRDQVLITTKGGEDLNAPRARAMHHDDLIQDMDESLQRLCTDHVDFYNLHLDDETVSVAEILDTLEELVRAGKTLRYGCSNWSVARQKEARAYANAHGLQGFTLDEIQYNLACNTPDERDNCVNLTDAHIALHEEDGVCVGGYWPIASGSFAKYVRDGDIRDWNKYVRLRWENEYTLEVCRRLKKLCDETGWTATQIQLACLLNPPFSFPSFLLIGASSPAQLEDSLSALDITLTPEMAAYLRPDRRDYPELFPAPDYIL